MPNWIGKRMIALKLRGLPEKDMPAIVNKYVEEILIPAQHPGIIAKLQAHLDKGDQVIIASAGYSPYIKEFARRLGITHIAATDLKIKRGLYSGRFDGLNCYGKNKIIKLKNLLELSEINKADSHVYSDDLSDKPLFDLVNHKHLVISERQNKTEVPDGYQVLRLF